MYYSAILAFVASRTTTCLEPIDSSVPDLQDLLGGLAPGVEAFLIDPSSDGLAQIADILAANDLTDLSSISIVGHGAAGQIQVGSTTLDEADLASESAVLGQIGTALAPDGDLQLYSCDTANGAIGQQFIADLSSFAGGATVAASSTDIGQTSSGENWTLDTAWTDNGSATPQVANPFTTTAEAGFSGTLGPASDPEIWVVGNHTGGVANELARVDDTTGNGSASSFVDLFDPNNHNPSNNPTDPLTNLNMIGFDTEHNEYFIAGSNSSGEDSIYRASISQTDPGTATPTLTEIFHDPNHEAITGMVVDPTSQEIFFTDGQNLYKMSENVSGIQTLASASVTDLGGVSNLATFHDSNGEPIYLDALALNLPLHVAYFTESTTFSTSSATGISPGGHHYSTLPLSKIPPSHIHNIVSVGSNAIYKGTLDANATSVTISHLVDVDPKTQGIVASGTDDNTIATDSSGNIYFTTVGDGFADDGGIYEINFGTSTINVIWQQNKSGTGATGELSAIVVDSATGKYYVTEDDFNNASTSNAIYVGNLSDRNVAPTLFEVIQNYAAGSQMSPLGMAIDNAPTFSSVTGAGNYALQGGPAVLTLSADGTDADSDNDQGDGAQIVITNAQSGDLLEIGGAQSGTLDGGKISYSYNSTTHTMTLAGTDSFAEYQTVIDSIQFQDTGTDNSTGSHPTRTITYQVYDGLLYSTVTGATTITQLINRAPTLGADSYKVVESNTSSGTAGTGGTGVLGNDSDKDGDSITVTAVNGSGAGVNNSVNGVYGELTLNSDGSFSYVADQTTAINGHSTGSHPVDSFNYTVSDGLNGTSTTTVSFTIDRPPVAAADSYTVVESNAVSGTSGTGGTGVLGNDSDKDGDGLTVTALNSSGANLNSATFQGTYGHFDLKVDGSFTYTADNTTAINSAASGSAPVDTFNYTISDGQGGSSTANVSFTVDRPPAVTTSSHTVKYDQGGSPVVIDSGVQVIDVNASSLASATVKISNFQTGDVLGIVAGQLVGNAIDGTNITESYNGSGTLTLTGIDSATDYQIALDEVIFSNTAASPSLTPRTIDFSATDVAGAQSDTGTDTVDVLGLPVVGGTGNTVKFYQGGPATALDNVITVTDPNGDNITGATVTIGGTFSTGDALADNGVSNGGTVLGSITASYNSSTHVLTLSGSDTAADYQTALREVTYSFSGDPTDAGADKTRTITWSVTDADTVTSAAGSTTTLDVFAQPIVSIGAAGTPTETSTSGPVIADTTLSITDYNGTTIHDATVQITGGDIASDTLTINGTTNGTINDGVSGTISYSFTGTTLTLTGTDTVVDYTTALDEVKFDAVSPNSGTRTLSWQVNDEAGGNTNDSVPVTTNVDVTFGPELTGGQNFGETEGTSTGPLQLVTFTDSEITSPTIGNFTAAIDWGDGTGPDTTGTIVSKGGGVFAVDSAGHTYAEGQAAPYQIAVTVTDTNSVSGTATDNAQVADAPLTAGTLTVGGGVEGTTPATLSATFSDANTAAPTSDFSGTIDWGDGNTTNFTSGDVAANGSGAFTVSGSHLYAEDGSDNVTVTINDVGGSQTTETTSTTVADAPLTAGTVTVGGGVEGTTPATLSATFSDANTGAPTGDFSGTIAWGDGNTTNFTSGDVAANGGGAFTVNGSHLYAEEGPDNVTVTINDKGGSQTIEIGSTTVADAPLTAGAVTVGGGVEGTTPVTLSAAFTDANAFATDADFSGTIDWGDGSSVTTFSSATITQPGGVGTPFIVNGTHTYAEEGPDNVTVTINDVGGSQTTETGSTTVADAPLTAGTVTVGGGVEGTTPATLSATFSDANTAAPTGDFSGTIDWGDGNTTSFTSGDVAANGSGAFTVSGAHTYAEEGPDNVTVTINDVGGSQTIETGSITVADAPLTAGTVMAGGGVEGVTPTTLSATFSDANTGAPNTDFSGTINWGDGDTTSFMSSAVTAGGGGNFTVGGSHQYLEEGSYTTTVTINDDGGSANGNSSTTDTGMTTVADAPLTAGTVTLSAGGVEGVTPTTLSATFSDANTGAPNTDFSGTIDWGDGQGLTTFDSADVTSNGGGSFTVSDGHQYAEEGNYTATVTINDDGGSLNGNSSTTDTGMTTVADAPLTGSGVTVNGTQDVSLTAPVATFTDANPNGSVSDFTATVTWGDGTPTSSGTITESGGVFSVTGTHTYTIQGIYMPTVTIVDDGGSTATVTDTFDIAHTPPTVTAGGTATYIGAGAVTLDAGVTVSDPDSGGDLAGATVTIGTGFIAGDTLEISGQASGAITDSGGTINYTLVGSTLALSGLDTLADYQAALDAVTYSFTPSNGDATKGGTDTSRTISWTVNDGAPSNGTSTAASTLLVPTTPVVTAAHAVVPASASESFTAAQLFSASDAAGAPILTYEVKDESTGSSQGFWVLNGAVLPNGQITTLTAAQLSQLSFVAGSASTPVSDTLEVAASDAAGLGAFTTFTVTAAAHAPTTAPTVTAANELQAPNLALAGSSLFSGTAFGGNTITSYEVEDTTTDSGHWVFNGVVEPTNQVIDVTVAQLAQLSFDTGYGSDTLKVRANDGTQWGSFTSFTVTPPPNAAPPAGTADTLVMLRNADGAFEFYDIGRNTILLDGPLGQINPALQVAGVGGFNGADTADLLMRDATTGVFTLYDVSNDNITGNIVVGQVGLEWTVSGFGDFSTRANETDMLMRNSNTGQFEVFDIANNAITFAGPMGQVGLEWSIAGFGDFSTRANETDMLMRNSNTGAFEVYDIANNAITSFAPMGQVGLEWTIAGFGDFSTRANETDMLMRNSNTGAFEVYDISNNTITSFAPMGQVGLEWTIAGFGDFSGNANETDMLMRNSNTGVFELYDISNNTIAPMTTQFGQVGLEWSISGVSATPASAPPTTQLSGIATDPAGAAPSSATAQLTQAMASFAPSAGAAATSSPLGQSSSVAETPNLFAAASQKPSAMA